MEFPIFKTIQFATNLLWIRSIKIDEVRDEIRNVFIEMNVRPLSLSEIDIAGHCLHC